MKLKNINPLGDVRVAALGMQLVKVGEVVDVGDEVAAVLVIQTLNWELVDKAPKAEQEAAARFIAEHQSELSGATPEPELITNTEEV